MRSEKPDFARAVSIDLYHWDVPVRVGLRPYVRFSRRLDGQLRKLVARWTRTAAPNALRLWRRR